MSSASNPNGTPCAQIDPNESLTLTAGAALQGKLFYKVRLDLEMTGNAVVNLTFARVAPNGSVLATGGKDGLIAIRDPATGAIKRTIKGHNGMIFELAFPPDGAVVATT